MRPDEVGSGRDQGHSNHGVELVKVFSQFAPVRAQPHSEICQTQAPGPRSEERIDVEADAGHAGYAGRQRNESANYRKEAANEYGEISPVLKEAVGPVEFTASHENPAAVAFDQGTSAVASDFIRHERSEVTSHRSRRRNPQQLERAGEDQIAGK